ncbi:MAG TPA: TetR/AcrR family transcriptional regulator [Solirubrobacteraceae bacterium]|nr:TetR/AcrR family transcriptional regulator [Solirubrobacteraceae bacterium]
MNEWPFGEDAIVAAVAEESTSATLPEPTTSERIVAAAAELFHEQGYHATTMRQIAARVGIKAGSLYNHFPGKQELLFSIAHDTMGDMLRRAVQAMSSADTPGGRLRAFVRAHTLYCIEERYRARVADDLRDLEPHNLERVLAIRDEYEQLLRDVLREGRDQSGWNVIDVPIVSFAFATMASAVSVWYREGGRLSPEEIADAYAEITLRAVRPSAAS